MLAALLLPLAPGWNAKAAPGRVILPGHVPAVATGLTPKGRLPATTNLYLAIGLPLRNEAALDELISQLYDPQSANFHKFLTPQEFTARFGPTEEDYQAVIQFAEANGLTVAGRHSNRVILDVTGGVPNVEHAFSISLRRYQHPTETRDFFAPDTEPSVPTNVPVADMWGLTDYGLPKPLARRANSVKSAPLNYNGSGPGGNYRGIDFRNAYVPGTSLTGAGQVAAVVEFDGYYTSDITNYEAQIGYTNVPLQNVLVDSVSGTPGYSGLSDAVLEVSLDIELLISMAPSLSKLIVYEGSSPYDVFNRIVTDNSARQISCSWFWTAGPTHRWTTHSGTTLDSQLKQMVAQGQSFFEASGDSDAYTGSQAFNSTSGPIPMDSIYMTSVGGTSLTMNGTGASWNSETVWNWGNDTGSGGGITPNYTIPSWQTNVSMATNGGSTTHRNVPDVAMTADAIYVLWNNGTSTEFVGGTSCAAPLWAGFCALVNQQSVATSGPTNFVGFLNPALYAIAASSNYNSCFHDIATGNNIGTNTPGLFNAVPGYDLATGLGTPNGTNLINALAPLRSPYFIAGPSSLIVTNGTSLALSATVGGQSPLAYKWLLNGAALSAGGNLSGTTSNVLSITAAATNNSGNYSLVATNSYGSVTSSVATLTVGFSPAFSAQPTNLTILSGSNAVFSAIVNGSAPFGYQWRKSGINLANGAGISGATTSSLTLTAVTTNSAGNYSVIVTNIFGSATSSAAALTVVFQPAIGGSLANQTVECGGNANFAVTASGTPPLHFQWSLDGSAIAGATNTNFSLTNVHPPNHSVALVVTNLYGSLSSNVVLTVHDTTPPVITLNGSNPLTVELGSAFTDPGATASDICAGAVAVVASGTVNTTTVGTNTILYTASDGNGSTNTVVRTVIVRDTTPPIIQWAFTNLVLTMDTNCSARLPDVTGTNFILAADLSSPLTISQNPTNSALLQLGTNVVVITVKDPSGNTAYSTNTVVVEDGTPPMISSQPQSQTNLAGTTAMFSVNATACTPLAYQWFFNGAVALANQTNNMLTLASVNTTNAGSYSVVVSASGGSSTSTVATLMVNLISVSFALNSSTNPSGYQDSVNFTASVTPSATGTVQFLTNSAVFDSEPLVSGQAVSSNLVSLPRGTNLVTAMYSGDANNLPATNTLAQIVTNHPPVAAAVTFSRVADLCLDIAISDLATNWTDVDGDVISIVAVSASTNGVMLVNDSGTLTYCSSNNVADQFVCTITDGWGGTNFQTVAISIAPPVNSTPNILAVTGNPDGSFKLSLTGAPGGTYVLESTTDLPPSTSWLPVATNTLGADGVWQFTDTQATNFPQRFYRLKLAP